MLTRNLLRLFGRINPREHQILCCVQPCTYPQCALSFIASQAREANQTFFDAIAFDKDLGQTRGIDAALKASNLDALVLLSGGASAPAAIAGYPIVTGMSH